MYTTLKSDKIDVNSLYFKDENEETEYVTIQLGDTILCELLAIPTCAPSYVYVNTFICRVQMSHSSDVGLRTFKIVCHTLALEAIGF